MLVDVEFTTRVALAAGISPETIVRESGLAEELRRAHANGVEVDGRRRHARIVYVADVQREEVEFLSDPMLPLGKLVMVDGFEGCGKTFWALAIAAAISRGWALPDKSGVAPAAKREPANVLYLSAEDGVADTLRPRLEAMGADLQRIAVLDGFIDENGGEGYFKLTDFDVLEQALVKVKPLFCVIDPVMAFLDADGNRTHEVRPILSRLAALAARYGCTLVLIRHFRKAAAERSSHRGVGSVDFSAACRSVLVIAEDQEDPTKRIVAHAKSNLAPKGPSLKFEIRDGMVWWIGLSEVTADELLESREQREHRRVPTARDSASEFLREVLRDGPVTVTRLQDEAKRAKVAWRTVERAKADLGVSARRVSEDSGAWCWMWTLPRSEGEVSS